MTDHKDRFIFVQSMGKPIVEAIIQNQPALTDATFTHIETACKKLYEIAGRIGPQENTEFTKMHPNTTSACRKKILKHVDNKDTLGIVEIRDELTQGQWAWVMSKLYSEDAKAAQEMLREFDSEGNAPDPDYLSTEDEMREKDVHRAGVRDDKS